MGLGHNAARQRLARFDRNMEKSRAALMHPDAVTFKTNVPGFQRQGLCHEINARQRNINREGNNRSSELRARVIADARDFHRHKPCPLLQPDFRFKAAARLVFHFRQQHGAANGGMPGEGHFPAGKENPHLRRVGRIFRLHHEDGFRQVELAGDRLHLLRGQSIGAEHHRQRISAEAAVGENIKRVKCKLHGAQN